MAAAKEASSLLAVDTPSTLQISLETTSLETTSALRKTSLETSLETTSGIRTESLETPSVLGETSAVQKTSDNTLGYSCTPSEEVNITMPYTFFNLTTYESEDEALTPSTHFNGETASSDEDLLSVNVTDDELTNSTNLSDYDDPTTSSTLLLGDEIFNKKLESSDTSQLLDHVYLTEGHQIELPYPDINVTTNFKVSEDLFQGMTFIPEPVTCTEDISFINGPTLLEPTTKEGYRTSRYRSTALGFLTGPFQNKVLIRKSVVAVGLMAIAQAIFSVGMINSGFLGIHLAERNISGTVYGLVGSAVGMGYMLAPAFGLFGRLHHSRGVSIHKILIGILIFDLLKSLGHGCSDFIPHNSLFAVVAVLTSILSGAASYTGCLSLVEGIRVWFPDNFQLISSLVTGTATYVGYGLFSYVGTLSYDSYGYQGPYFSLAGYIFLVTIGAVCLLPRTSQPISAFHMLHQPSETEETRDRSDKLSPLVMIPIVGQFLITMSGGFSIITSVPFLTECCDISVARASSLITTKSFAAAIGFIIAGIISQRRYITVNTQSILGCSLVILGMLTLFPSPALPFLYSYSGYTGYFAISLIGIGDPLVITVTIQNMEQIQKELFHGHLNPRTRSMITSLWLFAWVGGETAGKFLAGIFLDVMTFQQGAWTVAAAGVVAMLLFGILKATFLAHGRRTDGRLEPQIIVINNLAV